MPNNPLTDYTGVDGERFYDYTRDVLSTYTTEQILAIPGVAAIIQEELNNEILEYWEELSGDSITISYEIEFIDHEAYVTFTDYVDYTFDKSQNNSARQAAKAKAAVYTYARANLQYYDAVRFRARVTT